MPKLLHVKTSIRGEEGLSNQLADALVARWLTLNPQGDVVVRDLASDPVPYLDNERFGAFITPAADQSPRQQAVIAESDALIDEVRQADVLVIAMPMYNFSVPAQVSSWFDHLARVGVTFRYTEFGPQGLLEDKPVIFASVRGGLYSKFGGDHQTPLLTTFFEMIGLKNVRFVFAEGVNIDAELRKAAMDAALSEAATLDFV